MSGGQLIDGQIQSVYHEGWTGGGELSQHCHLLVRGGIMRTL